MLGPFRRDHPLGARVSGVVFLFILTLGFLSPWPRPEAGWVLLLGMLYWTGADYRHAATRPFLWAFLGLCLLSATWSAWGRTLEASLATMGGAWVALAWQRRYRAEQAARMTVWALAAALGLQLAAILLAPEHAVGPWGQWQGLFPHKNALGRVAGIAVGLCLFLPARVLGPGLRFGLLGLGGLLLFQSRSVTPVLVLGGCGLLFAVLQGLSRPRWRWATVLLGLLVVALLVTNWGRFLGVFGRSPVLTGRVKVWSGCMRYTAEQVTLGYGYGQVEPAWFPEIVNCHNGVLSLIIQVGMLGCLLFLTDAMGALVVGLPELRRRPAFPRRAGLATMVFFGLMNLAEVVPPHPGHFSEWVLYVAGSQYLIESDESCA